MGDLCAACILHRRVQHHEARLGSKRGAAKIGVAVKHGEHEERGPVKHRLGKVERSVEMAAGKAGAHLEVGL